MELFFTINNIADILGVSIHTVNTWVQKGTLVLEKGENGQVGFYAHQLMGIPQVETMINSNWEEESKVALSLLSRNYSYPTGTKQKHS